MKLTGAVLAVGDELLLGDIVNSNAAWLGEALAGVGVEVVHSAMVGDDVPALVTALGRALADADVVVLTGGLGPTSDDVTRDAVALVAGAPLERSAPIEQALRERFAGYGYVMHDEVLVQADVPRGARALDNPVVDAGPDALDTGVRQCLLGVHPCARCVNAGIVIRVVQGNDVAHWDFDGSADGNTIVQLLGGKVGRHATQRAISSGSPRRPTGMCGRIDFSITAGSIALTMSVAI